MAMVTGGRVVEADDMFNAVKFKKKGDVYKAHAVKKVTALEDKIVERQQRIAKIKAEYNITDADLFEALSNNQMQQTYSNSQPLANARQSIPAGILQNIQTERVNISTEKGHVDRLGLLARNIDVDVMHDITFDELEFLGF